MLESDFQNSPHLSTEHLPAAADLAQAGDTNQGWSLSHSLRGCLSLECLHSLDGRKQLVWGEDMPGTGIQCLLYIQRTLACRHPHSQLKVLSSGQVHKQVDGGSHCEFLNFNIKGQRKVTLYAGALPCSSDSSSDSAQLLGWALSACLWTPDPDLSASHPFPHCVPCPQPLTPWLCLYLLLLDVPCPPSLPSRPCLPGALSVSVSCVLHCL